MGTTHRVRLSYQGFVPGFAHGCKPWYETLVPKPYVVLHIHIHTHIHKNIHISSSESDEDTIDYDGDATQVFPFPMGTKVAMHFPSHGLFEGEITRLYPEDPDLCQVTYTDGDTQDLDAEETEYAVQLHAREF